MSGMKVMPGNDITEKMALLEAEIANSTNHIAKAKWELEHITLIEAEIAKAEKSIEEALEWIRKIRENL